MSKAQPIIFMMFAVVVLALVMAAMASQFGSDWTWIAQQNTALLGYLLLMGAAAFTLVMWLRSGR